MVDINGQIERVWVIKYINSDGVTYVTGAWVERPTLLEAALFLETKFPKRFENTPAKECALKCRNREMAWEVIGLDLHHEITYGSEPGPDTVH